MPQIPNFTKVSWQRRRSDARLLASILNGKGTDMPPMRRKVSKKQARQLVSHVRAFAHPKKKPGGQKQGMAARDSFEERYRRLQEQLDDLKRQADKLSKVLPGDSPSRSSPAPQHQVTRPSGQRVGTAATRAVFRQHCVKCHGADGRGRPARRLMPEVPDFTKASWQRRRSDAQLLASFTDGKGKRMPPWRGKISVKKGRGLVAYVRAFAPTRKRSGPK
jgi:mono/diheme cytochrome c family protein